VCDGPRPPLTVVPRDGAQLLEWYEGMGACFREQGDGRRMGRKRPVGRVSGPSSLSHWQGLERHFALQPCPSARPGVARARAAGAEGDRPACTKRMLTVGLSLWSHPRGRPGKPPRTAPLALHPCPREGGALRRLVHSVERCETVVT
jgi:hypothetical protein